MGSISYAQNDDVTARDKLLRKSMNESKSKMVSVEGQFFLNFQNDPIFEIQNNFGANFSIAIGSLKSYQIKIGGGSFSLKEHFSYLDLQGNLQRTTESKSGYYIRLGLGNLRDYNFDGLNWVTDLHFAKADDVKVLGFTPKLQYGISLNGVVILPQAGWSLDFLYDDELDISNFSNHLMLGLEVGYSF